MSLVENLINQISSVNGVSKPQGFNLEDDTFAKLLAKASEVNGGEQQNLIGQLGMPAGFQIEPINGAEITETAQINSTEPVEIKDLDMKDFFSNLLNDNTEVMNFAKKNAANAYKTFGKSFVNDLQEFVQDVAS